MTIYPFISTTFTQIESIFDFFPFKYEYNNVNPL